MLKAYKVCWKVDKCHRANKQNLGLGNYRGGRLRDVIAHLVTVALERILTAFMRACLLALKDVGTGEITRDWDMHLLLH